MVYLSRTAASRREDLGVKQVFNRDTRVAWRARYGRVRAQKEAPRATLSHKAMAERPIAGPWTKAGERPLRSSRVRRARGARRYVGERPRVVQELWQTLDDEQGEIFAKERNPDLKCVAEKPGSVNPGPQTTLKNQTNEGLANAADAATLGSGRQRRSRLLVARRRQKKTFEDACVEEDITSTAPSGRRNEPVYSLRRR